ncbi:MAG: hypothetical protein HKP58_04745 [Desulfatitalea sp.]|nr:hypothetical protein [Desulfatitalea sp.]NNJ99700.1 hypothetical protein [Desulfatitalea sp.]
MAGFAHLVLSPVQIAAGVLEGISALPYYMSTSIHDINKGLIDAQASITLDDTYDSAYGHRQSEVNEEGETGEVFRRMKHASQTFQVVLKKYGVSDYDRYILTSIDTANDAGYTLFAVAYRPVDSIRVVDKYDASKIREFKKGDRLFYEPFQKDAAGRPLDRIVDWAGMPRETIKTQKGQSMLLTLAANAVIENRSGDEYWEAEKQWIAREFRNIVETKMAQVGKKLKI